MLHVALSNFKNISQCTCLTHHLRALSSLSGKRIPTDRKPVMAIRRETINVWERRAPLGPHHVRKLVRKGVKVIVQPSDRRAYSMQVGWRDISRFFILIHPEKLCPGGSIICKNVVVSIGPMEIRTSIKIPNFLVSTFIRKKYTKQRKHTCTNGWEFYIPCRLISSW